MFETAECDDVGNFMFDEEIGLLQLQRRQAAEYWQTVKLLLLALHYSGLCGARGRCRISPPLPG